MRAFGMVMSFVMKNELYALSEASLQMALNLRGSPAAGYFFLPKSPGGRPGAGVFLLRGQEKGTKEKAALVSRHWRGFPVLLDEPGGCGTRAQSE